VVIEVVIGPFRGARRRIKGAKVVMKNALVVIEVVITRRRA